MWAYESVFYQIRSDSAARRTKTTASVKTVSARFATGPITSVHWAQTRSIFPRCLNPMRTAMTPVISAYWTAVWAQTLTLRTCALICTAAASASYWTAYSTTSAAASGHCKMFVPKSGIRPTRTGSISILMVTPTITTDSGTRAGKATTNLSSSTCKIRPWSSISSTALPGGCANSTSTACAWTSRTACRPSSCASYARSATASSPTFSWSAS